MKYWHNNFRDIVAYEYSNFQGIFSSKDSKYQNIDSSSTKVVLWAMIFIINIPIIIITFVLCLLFAIVYKIIEIIGNTTYMVFIRTVLVMME